MHCQRLFKDHAFSNMLLGTRVISTASRQETDSSMTLRQHVFPSRLPPCDVDQLATLKQVPRGRIAVIDNVGCQNITADEVFKKEVDPRAIGSLPVIPARQAGSLSHERER